MKMCRYIGCCDAQVNYGSNDDPRGILVEGELYEVWDEDVRSSHTKIELKDFRGLKFNSVCFEEVTFLDFN